MINDYPASQKKRRVVIGRELLAGAAIGLLYPFGLGRSKKRTERKQVQRTLVLLHGYGANRATMFPLAAYLRLRGIKKILFYDYRSRLGVEAAAIKFREYLRQHVKGGRIDLVGHSMGGVVARTYLQLLGGARRVDCCVSLGSPHQGTYNAYWIPNKVGDQLRPDSELIRRLNDTQSVADRVQFFSVIGGSDNIILPRVFARFNQDIHVPDVGHLGLLMSPRVMAEVARCLMPNRYDGDVSRVSSDGSDINALSS